VVIKILKGWIVLWFEWIYAKYSNHLYFRGENYVNCSFLSKKNKVSWNKSDITFVNWYMSIISILNQKLKMQYFILIFFNMSFSSTSKIKEINN